MTACEFRPLLIALALTGCTDPAAEQAARDRDNARLTVIGDAAFYWRCEHEAVQLAGQCRALREAYERDYAAFIARYDAER